MNWKQLIVRFDTVPPVPMLTCVLYNFDYGWPCGLMDKVSIYDTGDCGIKSGRGQYFFLSLLNNSIVWFKEFLCLLPNFVQTNIDRKTRTDRLNRL